MSDDVRDSLIPYDEIVQDALRAVVGRVLRQIEGHDSLPGEHHFYITFKTQAPGVAIPGHLIAKFPDEMTIVLQHRFWDLIISDDRFEVKLTFDGIPERLVVPFAAIKVFIDPSVRYGLQFDEDVSDNEPMPQPRHALTADATYDQIGEANPDSPRTATKKPRAPRKPRTVDKDAAASPAAAARDTAQSVPPSPEPATRAGDVRAKDESGAEETAPAEGGAKILSLDQFRKK